MDRQTFIQTPNLSIDAKTVTLLLLSIASSHKSRTGEGAQRTQNEWGRRNRIDGAGSPLGNTHASLGINTRLKLL